MQTTLATPYRFSNVLTVGPLSDAGLKAATWSSTASVHLEGSFPSKLQLPLTYFLGGTSVLAGPGDLWLDLLETKMTLGAKNWVGPESEPFATRESNRVSQVRVTLQPDGVRGIWQVNGDSFLHHVGGPLRVPLRIGAVNGQSLLFEYLTHPASRADVFLPRTQVWYVGQKGAEPLFDQDPGDLHFSYLRTNNTDPGIIKVYNCRGRLARFLRQVVGEAPAITVLGRSPLQLTFEVSHQPELASVVHVALDPILAHEVLSEGTFEFPVARVEPSAGSGMYLEALLGHHALQWTPTFVTVEPITPFLFQSEPLYNAADGTLTSAVLELQGVRLRRYEAPPGPLGTFLFSIDVTDGSGGPS